MRRWLALFVMPLALLAANAHAAPFDNPTNEVVEGSGGVPLVVQEWGNPEGPPVVLIHGFSFGAVSWKNQIGEIAEQARIIAFDLRGHGLSGKPWDKEAYTGSEVWAEDVAAVLAAKKIERPIIVGWSFGGYIAVDYLRHCGSHCARGLVLVSTLAGLVENPPQPDLEALGVPPNNGDVRADNYHDVFLGIDWTARVMTAEPTPQYVLDQKKLSMAMTPPYVRRAMAAKRLDNSDIARNIDLPVLLIHGGKDATIPRYKVDEVLGLLPNATALTYESSGHSPFEEETSRFNADLSDFLKSLIDR